MSAAPKIADPQVPSAAPKPRVNPWVIAGTVSLAAFMEVLDTSIANVALPYMAGGLAASVDDASWVLTSYLVANAVVLPISGWLSTLFGRKRFYMAAVVVFSVSSFLCGIAPSLGMLIGFRVLQGAGGGGLQPVSQAILKDTFPAERLGMAFALYGMVVVLAPAIGPTIGGWITDNYQWRWIFYMNIPVGIISLLLVSRLIEDPPYLVEQAKQARKSISIDYIGIGLLALCLGSLQVVLDRGQEDDWFISHLISFLAVDLCREPGVFRDLGADAASSCARSSAVQEPQLCRRRRMIFVYGVQVYAMTVFIPQFMQAFMGYDAELAGMTLAPGAMVMILLMPAVGKLVTRVQARWLAVAGCLASAYAIHFVAMNLDLQIAFRTAATYRALQSLGLALLFIPINTASYVGVPEEKGGEVSGFINLLRNVGGSVGISLVETMVARRTQLHQDELIAHVTPAQQSFRTLTDGLSAQLFHHGLSQPQAARQTLLRIYDATITQATVQSYMDVAWLIAVVCLLTVPAALMLRKNDPKVAHVSAE